MEAVMKTPFLILSVLVFCLLGLTPQVYAWIGPSGPGSSLDETLTGDAAVFLGTLGDAGPDYYEIPPGMFDGNTGRPGAQYRTAKFKISKVLFGEANELHLTNFPSNYSSDLPHSYKMRNIVGQEILFPLINLDLTWDKDLIPYKKGARFILVIDNLPIVVPVSSPDSALPSAKDGKTLYDMKRFLVQSLVKELQAEKTEVRRRQLIRLVSPIMTPSEAVALTPFILQAKDEIRKEAENFGPQDIRLATSLNDLADIYSAQGQYAEAEPLYKRTLQIKEKALGPTDLYVAPSLMGLADLYYKQGRYAEAEPLYKRALAIREKGACLAQVAHSLENYAQLLRKTNRKAEADKLEARAKEIGDRPR
jgi:tetratricopeptide (TPR) repeat protein